MAKESKDRIGYGVKIPSIPFEEAIRIVNGVSGLSGSIDTLATITNNSVSSSTFNYKVAALKNFGLLQSADKTNYVMTDLARDIANPESDEQKVKSIQESFTKHDLLNRVWELYKGKILPQSEYLANSIEKNFGIPAELKSAWAEYFINSAKFANLLIERESGSYQVLSNFGVVGKKKEEALTPPPPNGSGSGNGSGALQQPPKSIDELFNELTGGFKIQKTTGNNKMFYLYIPESLTDKEINNIKAILKGAEAILEGFKEDETA